MARVSDPTWAMQQLKDFVDASVSDYSEYDGSFTFRNGVTRDQLIASAQIVEQIIWQVIGPWEFTSDGLYGTPWSSHREGAVRAMAQLAKQDEIDEKLGTPAPKLDASALHPWVWESASTAWSAGGFGDAVRAAARAVNAKTRQKLNRKDLGEWKLMENAFSTKPPTPGEPRLRLTDKADPKTFESLHAGAGALARGLYMAVRNPANHEDDEVEIPEHLALEQLAAFSVLARFVDSAEVVRGE